MGRSVQRVSNVLGALRLAEVVRYDTDGKRNRYRLEHPSEVKSLLAALSRFVKAASVVGRWSHLVETTYRRFRNSGYMEIRSRNGTTLHCEASREPERERTNSIQACRLRRFSNRVAWKSTNQIRHEQDTPLLENPVGEQWVRVLRRMNLSGVYPLDGAPVFQRNDDA